LITAITNIITWQNQINSRILLYDFSSDISTINDSINIIQNLISETLIYESDFDMINSKVTAVHDQVNDILISRNDSNDIRTLQGERATINAGVNALILLILSIFQIYKIYKIYKIVLLD
jgi:hypothetical protein